MNKPHRFVAATCALLAFTACASAKVERVVEKSFQVQPGVHIRVATTGGEIRVSPSSDSMVRIVAKEHVRTSDEAEADRLLQDLELNLEKHGNEVVATAAYRTGVGFHFGGWPPVQVDFVITVPRRTSTDLKTSGGDIVVGDLDGDVRAHTSGGEIRLGTIGADVDVSTSGGDIEMAGARGSSKLSTSGGSVSVGRIGGPADLRTSGGDIRVDSVGNALDADTSGGNVKAVFDGPLKADCSLSTSGGEVTATVGSTAGFHLDAKSSGGGVNAAGIAIAIDHGGNGKSSLSGDVNGGGPVLKMRTSGGDIEVISRRE